MVGLILLVLVLSKCESSLGDRWILMAAFVAHEACRSHFLSIALRGHQLLRVDHRQNAIIDFLGHNHGWRGLSDDGRPDSILSRSYRLWCRWLSHGISGGRLLILLEGLEYFVELLVERGRILLMVFGRDAVHHCLEVDAVISLQRGGAAATQISDGRSIHIW